MHSVVVGGAGSSSSRYHIRNWLQQASKAMPANTVPDACGWPLQQQDDNPLPDYQQLLVSVCAELFSINTHAE
jgi:hypothetical protein